MPATFIDCSFENNREDKEVRSLTHFDNDASGEDGSVLYYIDGQLPEDRSCRVFIARLTPGQPPNLRPGGVLYRRGDSPFRDKA